MHCGVRAPRAPHPNRMKAAQGGATIEGREQSFRADEVRSPTGEPASAGDQRRRGRRVRFRRRTRSHSMAIDTLMVFVGVYDDVADAEADYELVKDLHTQLGLIDAHDAATVERREDGKTKISKKHETPTRVGGVLGGGMGLATGLVVALFPFA